MARVDKRTTIRAATADEAIDLSVRTLVAYFSGGAYPAAVVTAFAVALLALCRVTLIRASVLAGQIANETRRFKFGGQVRAEQFNWAGLGADDTGAAGLSFAGPEEAVGAVSAHHGGYLFGDKDRWPIAWMPIQHLAARLRLVLKAGYGGTVTVLGDYGGGPWATDPDYAEKVARHANALLDLEDDMAGPTIIDIRDELPTAPGQGPRQKRSATLGQVLHYSAVNYPKNRPILDILKGEAAYHIDPDRPRALKEGGLAYHQTVDPQTGDIYLCRDEDAVLWHCGYWGPGGNGTGLAIHVPGGPNLTMTPQAVQSLLRLFGRNERKYGFGRAALKSHLEVSQTDCPGPLHPAIVLPYRRGTLNYTGGDMPNEQPKVIVDEVTGHTVHPDLADSYNFATWGRPLLPAVLYSDGVIRQLFERGVYAVGRDGKPDTIETLGHAFLYATGSGDHGAVYPTWPGVVPLV